METFHQHDIFVSWECAKHKTMNNCKQAMIDVLRLCSFSACASFSVSSRAFLDGFLYLKELFLLQTLIMLSRITGIIQD